MEVSGQWLLDNFEPVAGFEIDPAQKYWYDGSTGEVRVLLTGWRLYSDYMQPWKHRRRKRFQERTSRDNYAVMKWEFDQLPKEIWNEVGPPLGEHFARCVEIVTGRHFVSDDMGFVEMAADTICGLLSDHPTAEKAFRRWFNDRYDYAI